MTPDEIQKVKEESLKRKELAVDVVNFLLVDKHIDPLEAYVILSMAMSQLYETMNTPETKAQPKCDGKGCNNKAIGRYHIWYGTHDWGVIDYCLDCVELDRSRGLTVKNVGLVEGVNARLV